MAIIGGGFAGCELGEILLDRGKKVTIIEESKRIGADIGLTTRFVVMGKFRKAGVKLLTKTKVKEITGKGVMIEQEGKEEFIEADTVVLAMGMKENKELLQELEGKVKVVHAAGDCVDPQKIPKAVKAGYRVGRDI